eukprot:CAMPEP_0168738358 /NCGR_PEP_ID=MMETSP0724-20121128/10889_1 /TAXON_ID=265536 /ORGANISM="Amphiprora sp., Strain CCMP467" /LENGTH=368 /DNA_ID=CAMNT_0008785693 /DNA_START=77 /DNA_END=1183 /DNA_ORIENTATION=+
MEKNNSSDKNHAGVNSNRSSDVLPWYDYQPGTVSVPHHVTCLRIGVRQAAAAANGSALEIIELQYPFCYEHTNLQQIQIHVQTVQGIPKQAFEDFPKLEQVEFVVTTAESPIAVAAAHSSSPVVQPRFTKIEENALGGCCNLHSVIGLEKVSGSLEGIGRCAFWCCCKLTTLDLSCLTRLERLGDGAFAYCKSLRFADLSKCVLLQVIEECTFWNCEALRIIHLPPKLKRIHREAFRECKALVSIVIPALVETMGMLAFSDCSSLTKVIFQSKRHLRSLMNYDAQFRDCTSLHTLELQGSAVPRKLWPRLLEQFLKRESVMLTQAGIGIDKQCISIAWNFVRTNIANFYVDEKKKAPIVGLKQDIHKD